MSNRTKVVLLATALVVSITTGPHAQSQSEYRELWNSVTLLKEGGGDQVTKEKVLEKVRVFLNDRAADRRLAWKEASARGESLSNPDDRLFAELVKDVGLDAEATKAEQENH